MTVTANTTRNDYTAGSAQSVYNYTFQLNEAADVDVYLDGVKQTLNTHYTVQNVDNATGGTITFTLVDANNNPIHPTQGAVINIVMAMDLDRDTNYQPSGAFLAADVNNDFDRLWHSTNQQQTAINRSLRLKDTDVTTSSMELPLKDDRKGKLLGFNVVTGDPEVSITGNNSSWDLAYDNMIVSAAFTGGSYTLTQQDGGTISTSLDGRYLPLAGGTLTGDFNVGFNKLTVGRVEIEGVIGDHSIIKETGGGDLILQGTNLKLQTGTGSESFIECIADGNVNIYHDGTARLSATFGGVAVNGGLTVSGTLDASGYNDSNWNDAYNNKITAVNYSGSTLTLTQQDGGTLTTTINSGVSQWTTTGNNIYYNTGNVGIGTDLPARALHVKSGNDTVRLQSTGSNTKIEMVNTGSSTNEFGFLSNNFFVSPDGTERMRIESSGNVGIGTDNPAEKLHISRADVGTLARFATQDGTNNPSLQLSTTATGVKARSAFGTGIVGSFEIETAGGSSYLAFNPNSTEAMRVKANGNVGIGTSSPALTDGGSGLVTHISDDTRAALRLTTTGGGGDLELRTFGSNGATIFNSANGELRLGTNATERMRIDSSGNVGIGTTDPASTVHIQASANALQLNNANEDTYMKVCGNRAQFGYRASDGYVIVQGAGGKGVAFGVNNATFGSGEAMRIDSSGKLLLNTSTHTLTDSEMVVASEYSASGTTTGGITLSSRQSGSWRNSGIFANGDDLTFTTGDTGLNGAQASSERMRIDSSGNVGIGTDNPASLLHLESASAPTLTINDTDSTLALELSQDGANGSMLLKSAGTLSIGVTNNSTSDALSFQTQSTERMRISADGKVAIGGAVDATVDLRVHGETTTNRLGVGSNNLGGYNIESRTSDAIHALFKSSSTTASYIYFRDGNSTRDGAAGIGAKGDECSIVANGSERIRIDSDGKVGIGVTDPSVALDVSGTIKTTTRLNVGNSGAITALSLYSGSVATTGTFESNATGAYIVFKDGTSDGSNVGIGAVGNECFIISGGSEKVRIDDNGNVGIGTNDPTEKLDVQGNITATGVAKLDGGSATAPAYTFDGDTNTGMYSPAADNLAFSEGGVERMRINSAGRVLIGTTSQGAYSAKLRVSGGRIEGSGYIATGNSSLFLQGGYQGSPTIECRSYTSFSSTTQNIMKFANLTGTLFGSITIQNNATSFNTSSDERLKENIIDAVDAGSKIDAIRIRQFDWKGNGEHQDYGVVAQELQSVAPEAVSEGYAEEEMWSVDYSKLVPTLIKEIQSLRNRVAQLEND
jgi:hypothetical protein